MKKWMIGVLLLGAGLGSGVVLSQVLKNSSIAMLDVAKPANYVKLATDIAYDVTVSEGTAKTIAQLQQAYGEADIRLQLIQVKQNAEIIRLLKKQVGEK